MRKTTAARKRPRQRADVGLTTASRNALNRGGALAPLGRDRLLADLRLQVEYPGKYVAYIDRIKTVRQVRRLSRGLLAHGASLQDVQDAVNGASPSDQARIVIVFVEGCDD